MERYQILTGEKLSIEKYLETWRLDNTIFDDKDKLTKKVALEWFEYSDRSTIVLWDCENDRLVGYISPFLMKHSFAADYIVSDKTYKEAINKKAFANAVANTSADIYIFSTAIVPQYRDKKLTLDKKSKFYNKSAF